MPAVPVSSEKRNRGGEQEGDCRDEAHDGPPHDRAHDPPQNRLSALAEARPK